MKRLVPDPWLEAAKKYKIGTIVQGEVNRITPFGAFVKLNDEINGLIHVTEIDPSVKDPGELLKIGDTVSAKVIAVEPDEHRVGLSIKALKEKAGKKEVAEKEDEVADDEVEDSETEVEEVEVEVTKDEAAKKKDKVEEKPKKKIVKKKAAAKDKDAEEKPKKKIVKKKAAAKKAE